MTFLTSAQVRSMTTTQICAHFAAPFTITVTRSERTGTPLIVFHSQSAGLCSALAAHHAAKLNKMQSTWRAMTGSASKERNSDTYFSTIMLKGLRPSTLKAWIAAAKSAGFVVNVADNVFWSQKVTNEMNATTVVAHPPIVDTTDVWEQPISTEIVDEIPTGTRAVYQVNHRPFGLPGKVATVADLRKVLRAQGKCTSGNKAALLARL